MATFDLSDYGTVIVEDLSINGEIVKSIPSGLPIGTIIPWQDLSTIPNGWSLCDGSATYTDLGGQTKTIPDLRSRFIIGYDSRDTSFNIDTSGSSFVYREADSDSHDPRNAFALGDVNDLNNSTTDYERVYYSLAYIICVANPFTNSTGDKTITGNVIATDGVFSGYVTADNLTSATCTVTGSFSVGRDTDSTSYLGKSAIGYNGTTSDFATLSHIDHNTSTNYGFGQTSDGSTHINAASDANISLRIADQEKIIVTSDGNLGIGASNPVNKLDVSGSVAIGSGYAGLSTAPTDGLIVQGNVGIGTATPSVPLEVNGEIRGYGVCIVGSIIMWSGTLSSDSPQDVNGTLHTNWKVCNGSNGTPDLRNRFIIGANSNSDIGNTGGSNSLTLTAQNLPNHSHGITIYAGDDLNWNTNGPNYPIGTDNVYNGESDTIATTATGGGQAIDNRPSYYALAFIMRIS